MKKKSAAAVKKKRATGKVRPKSKEDLHSKPYPIVAIGASAGGIEAITELLSNLSPDTGMAFVYIQHLDPTHKSLLSQILSKSTRMPVLEAKEHMHIQANHVFVIPPGKGLTISDGVLTLNQRPRRPAIHFPINEFFISLAEKQKEGGIGIILSGNGSDGTMGLKAIKSAGGITMAQDDSARFQSMPRSAAMESAADLVLSPKEIAKELDRLSTHMSSFFSPDGSPTDGNASGQDLISILQLLRRSTGVDFSNYKKTTIQRRVERRMLLYKLTTLKAYLQYMKQHAAETEILFRDLLINVTSFFRDPELSRYLSASLLPRIIREKGDEQPIRIWIPACSTGQEAYSFAMLLVETLGSKAASTPVQIFASDLSDQVVAKARSGLYTKSEVSDISPARLSRFFQKEENNYRVVKSIRNLCVFASHNIFKDPPFSRLDVISCRNLLIYLDPVLQKKAIDTFHYALNPGGYMILGRTESAGASPSLFSAVNKKLKVYQGKKDRPLPNLHDVNFQVPDREVKPAKRIFHPKTENEYTPGLEKTVNNLLLGRYVPACVVVNADLEILQFRGSTGLFLEPSPGKASLNLLKMARSGLGFELRSIVHKALKSDKPIRKSGIEIKNKNLAMSVSIEVAPFKDHGDERYFLILFEEDRFLDLPLKEMSKDKRVAQLEKELLAAREDMSAIIEEREAMNEELQSANEEVVSSNEELQSINEELETSKEEIESTNEELLTINQELQSRNDQLTESFNFADAVFGTMREAIVVLNEKFRIMSANRRFYEMFHITEEETIGRLIYELKNQQWDIPKLHELLEEIIPQKKEFYNLEIEHLFPEMGEKVMILNAKKIDQPSLREKLILIAIEDFTDHLNAIKEKERWFREVANNAPVMIWITDKKGNHTFFNKTWLQFSGKDLEEEVGMGWLKSLHPDDVEPFLKIFNAAIAEKIQYKAEYRLRRNDGEYRWMLSVARPSFDAHHKMIGYIGTATEIHDQRLINAELEQRVKQRTQALQEANNSLERSNSELQQFAYVASHDLQEPLRKIVTFVDRLQKKYDPNLPEEAKDYMLRIVESSKRMTRLINDLLNFSRVTKITENFSECNLNDVFKSVLRNFDLLIQQTGAEITVGKLPVINAVPVQMMQLFHNLISNAMKFSFTNEKPRIAVASRYLSEKEIEKYHPLPDGKKAVEITVTDNGIGFRQEFAEQIFDIFQRLHSKGEYPGTGIGLALCKKIVENHGGVIFANSEENKGATIHVLLPA